MDFLVETPPAFVAPKSKTVVLPMDGGPHTQEGSYLCHILQGTKTVEGRRLRPTLAKLKPGDTLQFGIEPGAPPSVTCDIERTALYPGATYQDAITSMVDEEGFSNLVPNAASREEAIEVYKGFLPSTDTQKSGGEISMIALHIKNPRVITASVRTPSQTDFSKQAARSSKP